MREKTIEQRLVNEVKKRGGIAPKWVAPGFDGVPDRLVFLPGRHFAMVEVKAPGEKPRKLQRMRIKQLQKLGFRCYVIDSMQQVADLVDRIGGGAG